MSGKKLRYFKYIVIISFLLALFVGWNLWVMRLWQNPNTWDSGLLEDLKRLASYQNLDLSIDSIQADQKNGFYDKRYTFRYVSLIGIEKQGEQVTYLFSFLPYSYLMRVAHNKDEYIKVAKEEEAFFQLTIPITLKPIKFLDREVFSTATYTSEPEELMLKHKPVPVSVSFVYRQYDRASSKADLFTKVKHWIYVLQHKKEKTGNKVVSWELIKLKTPQEYVDSLGAEDIDKKLREWSDKVWRYYKSLCFGSVLDNWVSAEETGKELLKVFYKNCHSMYDRCTLNDCNNEERPVNPTLSYVYLMYLAYHRDLDLYRKLKYIYKLYFVKGKVNDFCGDSEYGWCSFWPATFSAYPVLREKELLNFYLKEVAPKYAFSNAIVKGNGDKALYDLKYWFSFVFQNYGKAEYLVLSGKKGCTNVVNDVKLPNNVKQEIKRLLAIRGVCQNLGNNLSVETLLRWPINRRLALMYVYESTNLSPYKKDVRLFRPSVLVTEDNNIDLTSYNQKDNILTLIIAYESAKEK